MNGLISIEIQTFVNLKMWHEESTLRVNKRKEH